MRRSASTALALALLTGCGGGAGNGVDPQSATAWGSAVSIGTAPAIPVAMAMLDDRSYLLVTQDFGGGARPLVMSHVAPDGKPLRSMDVLTAFNSLPSVAADGKGGAVLARIENVTIGGTFSRRVVVRNFSRGTGFTDEVPLTTTLGGDVTSSFKVVTTPSGSALAAWIDWLYAPPGAGGIRKFAVFASRYSPSSGWAPAVQVSAQLMGEIAGMDVAMAPNGGAVIAWSEPASPLGHKILAAQGSSDGSWTAPQTVFDDPANPQYQWPSIESLQVAIGTSGNAVAAWDLRSIDGFRRIDSSRYRTSSGWLGVQTHAQLAGRSPTLAMNSSGQGVLAWSHSITHQQRLGIVALSFDESSWQTQHTELTRTDLQFGDASLPQAVIDEGGRAAVSWSQAFLVPAIQPVVIRGSRFAPTTNWSAATTLSSGQTPALHTLTSNAIDGRATILWREGDVTGGSWVNKLLNFGI